MTEAWRVSLHGGHSGEFCDHAEGALREVLDAAVASDFAIYGVSEHAPRDEDRFLYAHERELGWTVEKIQADFREYAAAVRRLVSEYKPRLTILCGMEAEVVPSSSYDKRMLDMKNENHLDYMVGSVHYVDEIQIDGDIEDFRRAVQRFGDVRRLAAAYYEAVTEMVERLKPEVVGHLDLIKKNVQRERWDELLDADVARSLRQALETIQKTGGILDLNTAGWRKGLAEPYPGPEVVKMAAEMGIPFCFGDDSHGPKLVGYGLDRARNYLLGCDVTEITRMNRKDSKIIRETVSL